MNQATASTYITDTRGDNAYFDSNLNHNQQTYNQVTECPTNSDEAWKEYHNIQSNEKSCDNMCSYDTEVAVDNSYSAQNFHSAEQESVSTGSKTPLRDEVGDYYLGRADVDYRPEIYHHHLNQSNDSGTHYNLNSHVRNNSITYHNVNYVVHCTDGTTFYQEENWYYQ